MRDENYYSGKSSNTGLIIVVTLLAVAVIGLIGFIVYDKVVDKPNDPSVEENNKETDKKNEQNKEENNNSDKNDEYNYSNIDKDLNKYLSFFINFRGKTNGTNLLATAEGRLELLNSYLMENELCIWHDDEIMQRFPYVKYDSYSSKYKALFGSENDLDTDLKNVDGTVANDCSDVSSISGKNICWNGNWGDKLTDIELNSTKVSNISDNIYSIIGNYTNKATAEVGTFEIQYVKTNSTKYLTSIKLTEKK